MTVQFFLLDTFTTEIFKGNPTPVCIVDKAIETELMNSIAKEFNQPVTAFIEPKNHDEYPIRYFTVTGEIPACGHATLAAAKIISDLTNTSVTRFRTIENTLLDARLENDIIFMTYPKFERKSYKASKVLLNSLGLRTYRDIFFCSELEALFIELETASELRTLSPNYKALVESDKEITEVVITSESDDKRYDFLLRSFCPWIGIDEDPVTGSVHCVLPHYWKDKLQKSEMTAYQASKRGGEVYVKALDNNTELGGKNILLSKGILTI